MTLLETGNAGAAGRAPKTAEGGTGAGGPQRPSGDRPRVDGKFLAAGAERLIVRGVTYGTFAPDANGDRFPDRACVQADLEAIAASGVNAVRTYTPPPRWLLDDARAAGVWVMAGLPWEQHVALLDDRRRTRAIAQGVRAQAAAVAGHEALLCVAIGNEVPPAIARWHGRARVERFLDRLCAAVRAEDPAGLVTYVGYPGTEHLRVPAADFAAFNVYLEDPTRFAAYVARLQILAGDRPLLLTELGLDSRRNGETAQARAVGEQVSLAFAGGCTGAFVFAWTDSWHRGEDEVLDWDFGVTNRRRRPKPALRALREAYTRPAVATANAPSMSVIVCTHNGAGTLSDCLEGVAALRYPNFETIVVDDGSTDASAEIATLFGARVIRTENEGLSAARNTGLAAAHGEIVAYVDDDARPDPDWLAYLAMGFATTPHAAIGGPNVPPPGDGRVASCVANAPGGPVHVLVSDTEAEHLPGCNMAFRRAALVAAGGFDRQFRVAGDDVDLCWRLRDRGETLGFHPAALVWHHRRGSVRAFWRQQRGYGHAEALLERKWPQKYDRRGHPAWAGRLYGPGVAALLRRGRIYHGTWGTGAFQPEVGQSLRPLATLAAAPEWPFVIAALVFLALLGLSWHPLLTALPVAVIAAALPIANACRGARVARFDGPGPHLRLRALTALLYVLQPLARLAGRVRAGLVPWRRPAFGAFTLPRPRSEIRWYETWQAPEARVARVDAALRERGARVLRGGAIDRWDLEVAGGAAGAVRVLFAVEEHGRGRQLLRCRVRPRVPRFVLAGLALAVASIAAAVPSGAWVAAAALACAAAVFATAAVAECGLASAAVLGALEEAGA
jgi:GT2 family glycosyltransferase